MNDFFTMGSDPIVFHRRLREGMHGDLGEPMAEQQRSDGRL